MSGASTETLLDLIYDTAADARLWPAAMQAIAAATDSLGGILIGQQLDFGGVQYEHNGGLDPDCNVAYRTAHVDNIWSREMIRRPSGRLVLSDEIVPLRELRRTAFHADVLAPQAIAHNAMCAFAVSPTFLVAFNVCRTGRQGPLGATCRDRLRALLPHVRRSLLLAHRIEAYAALHGAGRQALDRLAMGVVLLAAGARVVFANAAAARVIGEGGPVRLRHGCLVADRAAVEHGFASLFGRLARGAPMASMTVPRGQGRGDLLAVASAVRGRDRERFAERGFDVPSVMLFLIDPSAASEASPDMLRHVYALTAAEARVAVLIGSGIGIAEASRRLGVSANTVKTHLARAFAKTGTRRQSDLARLLAGIGALRPGP